LACVLTLMKALNDMRDVNDGMAKGRLSNNINTCTNDINPV